MSSKSIPSTEYKPPTPMVHNYRAHVTKPNAEVKTGTIVNQDNKPKPASVMNIIKNGCAKFSKSRPDSGKVDGVLVGKPPVIRSLSGSKPETPSSTSSTRLIPPSSGDSKICSRDIKDDLINSPGTSKNREKSGEMMMTMTMMTMMTPSVQTSRPANGCAYESPSVSSTSSNSVFTFPGGIHEPEPQLLLIPNENAYCSMSHDSSHSSPVSEHNSLIPPFSLVLSDIPSASSSSSYSSLQQPSHVVGSENSSVCSLPSSTLSSPTCPSVITSLTMSSMYPMNTPLMDSSSKSPNSNRVRRYDDRVNSLHLTYDTISIPTSVSDLSQSCTPHGKEFKDSVFEPRVNARYDAPASPLNIPSVSYRRESSGVPTPLSCRGRSQSQSITGTSVIGMNSNLVRSPRCGSSNTPYNEVSILSACRSTHSNRSAASTPSPQPISSSTHSSIMNGVSSSSSMNNSTVNTHRSQHYNTIGGSGGGGGGGSSSHLSCVHSSSNSTNMTNSGSVMNVSGSPVRSSPLRNKRTSMRMNQMKHSSRAVLKPNSRLALHSVNGPMIHPPQSSSSSSSLSSTSSTSMSTSISTTTTTSTTNHSIQSPVKMNSNSGVMSVSGASCNNLTTSVCVSSKQSNLVSLQPIDCSMPVNGHFLKPQAQQYACHTSYSRYASMSPSPSSSSSLTYSTTSSSSAFSHLSAPTSCASCVSSSSSSISSSTAHVGAYTSPLKKKSSLLLGDDDERSLSWSTLTLSRSCDNGSEDSSLIHDESMCRPWEEVESDLRLPEYISRLSPTDSCASVVSERSRRCGCNGPCKCTLEKEDVSINSSFFKQSGVNDDDDVDDVDDDHGHGHGGLCLHHNSAGTSNPKHSPLYGDCLTDSSGVMRYSPLDTTHTNSSDMLHDYDGESCYRCNRTHPLASELKLYSSMFEQEPISVLHDENDCSYLNLSHIPVVHSVYGSLKTPSSNTCDDLSMSHSLDDSLFLNDMSFTTEYKASHRVNEVERSATQSPLHVQGLLLCSESSVNTSNVTTTTTTTNTSISTTDVNESVDMFVTDQLRPSRRPVPETVCIYPVDEKMLMRVGEGDHTIVVDGDGDVDDGVVEASSCNHSVMMGSNSSSCSSGGGDSGSKSSGSSGGSSSNGRGEDKNENQLMNYLTTDVSKMSEMTRKYEMYACESNCSNICIEHAAADSSSVNSGPSYEESSHNHHRSGHRNSSSLSSIPEQQPEECIIHPEQTLNNDIQYSINMMNTSNTSSETRSMNGNSSSNSTTSVHDRVETVPFDICNDELNTDVYEEIEFELSDDDGCATNPNDVHSDPSYYDKMAGSPRLSSASDQLYPNELNSPKRNVLCCRDSSSSNSGNSGSSSDDEYPCDLKGILIGSPLSSDKHHIHDIRAGGMNKESPLGSSRGGGKRVPHDYRDSFGIPVLYRSDDEDVDVNTYKKTSMLEKHFIWRKKE